MHENFDNDGDGAYAPKAPDGCYVWCTDCGVRLKESEVVGWGCPKCGNSGVPCDPDQDVKVEVNWHELRILGIWAENYAQSISGKGDDPCDVTKTVRAICSRLESQWPGMTPLTLSGELAELPEALAASGITVSKVVSDLPPSQPFLSLGTGAVGFGKEPARQVPMDPLAPDAPYKLVHRGVRVEVASPHIEARLHDETGVDLSRFFHKSVDLMLKKQGLDVGDFEVVIEVTTEPDRIAVCARKR